ncbi:MAG TPA: hypothetical protein ENK55_07815 [Actinobacteria bacterium]|nr:hypothetical protein [Actinomycetota bacterium]
MRDDGDPRDELDALDELFEPFELDDPPVEGFDAPSPPPVAPPPPPAAAAPAAITCPSCGSPNPLTNHHCEQCGARLGKEPLPLAPPPTPGASPGMRALGMLAALVLVVALGALVLNTLRGGGDPAAETIPTSTTTTTQPPVVVELFPSSVVASSELPNLPAEHLIDGDTETYWNDDSLQGKGAWLKFRFSEPVSIKELRIHNLTNEEKFKRNFRIKGYSIRVDDLDTVITGRLDDTMDPQPIPIASLATTELTLEVLNTYPAQAYGDAEAYNELAVAEVRFFGTKR